MTPPEFERQTDQPLFPNVLYNRPVTRHAAGRLLVPGGFPGEFSLPTTIYQLSLAAGVGECNVVLPETLAKLLGGAPGTSFAATNPSGSLGSEALGRILELAEDADAVAIGASLSGNSNTAILIEKLARHLPGAIVYFGDALTALQHNLRLITDNPRALVIATMPEIFKLCGALQIPIQIRPHAGLINKLEIVQDLANASACSYAVYGTEIIVAAGAPLIVTPTDYRLSLTPALFYAVLATFWLQNRTNHRAGLAAGSFVIAETSRTLGTAQPSASTLANHITATLRKQDNF